jgi:hypothetical protein
VQERFWQHRELGGIASLACFNISESDYAVHLLSLQLLPLSLRQEATSLLPHREVVIDELHPLASSFTGETPQATIFELDSEFSYLLLLCSERSGIHVFLNFEMIESMV